ncbi:hypothetical protein PRIPAC_93403 [Pristionchus pacificus]|uniref:Uncharacterized protein n=1 Tax=Pristionchus pacificus TaxID=54126 RepID=A0A2A6CE36_PRIPA|nr:hypothetical protein PRIPAC_93403 [Pristionchus pacificus]|eukprot:PDM76348.1 hypothetical protein PRIPAC_39952 [Pristionchus pacificus]
MELVLTQSCPTSHSLPHLQVVIRGSSGEYIQHYWGFNNAKLVPRAQEWEMLTPVRNPNGSWSFKSRWNKWLSGGGSAFSTIVCTSVSPSPRSPRATQEQMKELMEDGGRRRFKAHNGWYLTEDTLLFFHHFLFTTIYSKEKQGWAIERMNDNEIVIRGHSGEYIQHSWGFFNAELAPRAQEWEMLTPVKNPNGSWSFKSRWNKWLSGRGTVSFEPHNGECEQWWLEPW